MHKTQAQVKSMMLALDLPLPHTVNGPGVRFLTSPHIELLRSLVSEEHNEFQSAMRELDESLKVAAYHHSSFRYLEDYEDVKVAWVKVIDAMCDMIVTIHNTSNAMNLDLEPFFDEVHRTNMLKKGGLLNSLGKRLKPPGWKPPQLRKILDSMMSNRVDKKEEL